MQKQLITSLLVLSLNSCGDFSSKIEHNAPNPKPEVTKIFVHGDPTNIIKGASLNKDSIFNVKNIKSFENFHFSKGNLFIEKEKEYNPSGWDEVEDSNSTTDNDVNSLFKVMPFKFQKKSEKLYSYSGRIGTELYTLNFKEDEKGNLNIISLNGDEVEALHYSLKEDTNAFSILYRFKQIDPLYGKILMSLTFAKTNENKKLPDGIKDFSYIYNNIPIRWEKNEIRLDVCGVSNQETKDSIEKSMMNWSFENRRDSFNAEAITWDDTANNEKPYKISIRFLDKFHPYSDLNEHCINLVSGFKQENSTNFYIAGVTLPTVNMTDKTFIDSDILIFVDHVEFSGSEAVSTVTHEIGHFLGLGHEFAKTLAGTAKYPSVMGYSNGYDNVQVRDLEAIFELYQSNLITE